MTPSQANNMRRAQALARLIVQSYRDDAPAGCDPQNIEGWAAAAVAVAAVGASAYSAYSSSSAAKSQAQALSHQPGVIPYQPVDPTQSYSDYENYRNSVLPQANADAQAQNAANNTAFQGRLSATSPNLLSGISQEGTVANQLLKGQIPSDVAGQVTRSSAYQALNGGYAGSDASRALTARDLGTTSLSLQQQGASMLAQNLSATAAVNPYNATADQSILSANQFLGRDDQNDAIANATANKNKNIQFQNSLYANAASNINPTAGAITSGIGTLSSLYFGGAGRSLTSGGGGGGGGSYGAAQQQATQGYYNPYLDPTMYNNAGNYIGSSYGGG